MAAILVTTVKRFIGTAVERVALDTTGLQAGSTFYETDTKRFYIYSGAAWVEKPREANLDNLDIALSLVSSNITGAGAGAKTLANVVTALANIANLDITSTAVKEGIAGAGAGAKTLADIVSALTGTLTVQLTGSIPGTEESYIIPLFDLLAWSGFTNQPDGDDVEIVSDSASDNGKCTVFYTKKSDGTFAHTTVTLTGVTEVALTGATDVDDVLGVFLGDIEGKNISPAVGTITLREASANQTITTIVATKISKGMVAFDLTGKQIILNVHSGNVWKRCTGVVTTANGFKLNLTGGNIKEEKIASYIYLISDTTGATAQIEVMA